MAIEKTIINEETIHLKNNKWFGWKVVHPYTNEDGSKNWPNIIYGGKGNLISTLFILAIIVMVAAGFNSQLEACRDMAANPCKYFDCTGDGNLVGANINLDGLNLNSSAFATNRT